MGEGGDRRERRRGHGRHGGAAGRPVPRAPRGDEERAILYGWHPVVEALRNNRRRLHRLVATENSARRLAEELGDLPLAPEIVRPDEINRRLEPDAVHQGLYLEAEPLPSPSLD